MNGCFNKKDTHSVGFVVRWLEQHCHRLIFPVHRSVFFFVTLMAESRADRRTEHHTHKLFKMTHYLYEFSPCIESTYPKARINNSLLKCNMYDLITRLLVLIEYIDFCILSRLKKKLLNLVVFFFVIPELLHLRTDLENYWFVYENLLSLNYHFK